MSIDKFSEVTINELKYYVYIYSDPDTRIPFYVGKGKGNRVFSHLSLDGESEKVNKIKEIQGRGKQPLIEILVHGISEETAFRVEAAVIDLIGIEYLTNEQRGYHSSLYGRKEISALEALYSRKELKLEDITDNIILIKINQLYRNDMSVAELYDITRGVWRVNLENAQKAEYAFAVFAGVIMEVYTIAAWFPAGTTHYCLREDLGDEISDNLAKRYEFVGNVAPHELRKKYIYKSVSNIFSAGAKNPIQYFMRKASI